MPIEFIMGPNDLAIPAQKVKTVYLRPRGGNGYLSKLDAPNLFVIEREFYVNHFETCPQASSFSQSKRT